MEVRVAAASVLLGVGLAACGGGGGTADIASRGGTSSTGATTTLATTTLPGPSTSTSAAVPPVSGATSTTARRPSTTRGPATTRGPVTTVAPTATTKGPPAPPRCEDGPLTVEVTTERTTYRPGEIVKGTFTMRNTSGAACVYRNVAFTQTFEDAAGRAVGNAGSGHTDGFFDSEVAAGATITVFDLNWDQRTCSDAFTCIQAPPGTYTAEATFTMAGTQQQGSKAFQLVAA